MNYMKQIRPFFLPLILAVLIWFTGCCPPPPPPPVPNPLVKFDLPNSAPGFSVTYANVAQSTAISLKVFDAAGDSVFSANGIPGQEQVINIPSNADNPRPLQLCFRYKTSSGEKLADDSLRVDDRTDLGVIPDMDVEMGVAAQTNCPSTDDVDLEDNGPWKVFGWEPGDQFEVTFTPPAGSPILIRLHPEQNQQTNKFVLKCYKQSSYTCLSNPTTTLLNENRLMRVTVVTQFYEVRAYDNINGSTRRIEIKPPSGYSVSVKMNHVN